MPATHLIRLLPDGAAEWLALARDGRVLSGPQSGLPSAAAEEVTVLVPGEDVLLLRAPRVARQRRQLEQAVPFAIEEQLVAPVESLHVALDDNADSEDLGVAVIDKQRLEHHLAPLRAAGIEPDRLLPDAALLPWQQGSATVLIEGERALLRYGTSAAFAGHARELPDWLSLIAGEASAPARLRWIGAAPAVAPAIATEREDLGTPLRWFAEQASKVAAPNLLQGAFAPRRGREGARKLWRWAAMLAGAALLLGLTHMLWEQQQLQSRYAAQRAEMEQLLRAAMPGITRVVEPRAQLAAELSRRGSNNGEGLLPLLARIAPVLSGTGQYTVDGLEYRGQQLELIVRGADVGTLDRLRETLAASGLKVELTSVNPGSGGVEGRLRIARGGA